MRPEVIHRVFLCIVCVLLATVDAAAASTPGYAHYVWGDPAAPGAGQTQPGLMLLGGGDWPVDAFRWFVAQAGGGHIVILRASGADELQQEFLDGIGGATSVETLVFSDRAAASDPEVLRIIRNADGIFLGGGDQSRYVRFWKGTPVNELLDAHVRAGKPIGGTSAGLAILGGYSYGALDGGSLESSVALRNPMGTGVTLVRNFLHLPYLADVITDTHFAIRSRQGRLVTFLARLAYEEKKTGIAGLGVDEGAAVCIDSSGIGRFYTIDHGHAWLMRPHRIPERRPRGPLTYRDIPVTGVGTQSRIDFNTLTVGQPAFELTLSVVNGSFDDRSAAAIAAIPVGAK